MRLRERSPGLWKQRGYIGIGNRRGMGGMTFRERIAALMNGSEFYAPLTHTAIPTRAAFGTTGTFTRATTSTWQNNDGYMVTGVAGEIGFVGARRIYNLWTTSSVSLASGANKSLTLAAGTYAFSMGAGTGTATFSGTGGATGTLAASASGRVSVNKTISAGTFVVTASVADLADLQVESLTAQTTQTAGEYVSVGVESAPYYHGSFVDGVKCFPTDLSGNPLTGMLGYQAQGARTNLCLQSNAFTTTWVDAGGTSPDAVQNATGPNGQANYAWTLTDNSAVAYEAKAQTGITFTAGQSGCFSVLVEKKTSGPAYPGIQLNYNVASGIASGIIVNEVAGTIAAFPTGGSVTAPTAMGIETYNDGVKPYWLVWVSNTQAGATATATVFLYPSVSSDGTTLSAAAQGSTVFCDAQFESGATYPSSRIATTTVAVTRNADVLTYSSAGNIDGTKGWCYAEASAQWSAATGVYNILVGIDTANRGPLLAIDNAPTAIYIADGTNAVQATGASTTFNSTSKRASTWGGSAMSVTGSGAAVASGAFDGNMNVGANITVGILDNGGSAWFGTIRNVRIGQRQLSASELGAITA